MEILISSGLVVLGFVLLLKGADFLVTGASSFAKKFNVSELAIGLTIVAMGTSAPELVVNLVSSSQGYDDVVFGNIIGSNIFNLFFILAICGIIKPIVVQSESVWKEIPFAMLLVFLFFILSNDSLIFGNSTNELNWIDGIILLTLFFAFLAYVYFNIKNKKQEFSTVDTSKIYSNWITFLMVAGGLAGLIIGGKLVVDNAVLIARSFDISEKLIGLTIIAAGTSLPELAASAVAAFKGKSDIAIGNIIGSNIFNLTFILGLNSIITPLTYSTGFNFDVYVLMGGSVALFLFMFTLKKKKLDRREAFLFLLAFIAYMTFIIIRK